MYTWYTYACTGAPRHTDTTVLAVLFLTLPNSKQFKYPSIESLEWFTHVMKYYAALEMASAAAAAAKSFQSCPTLCDPIDGSSSGSPSPGILQARTLKWVATSFSNAWKWKVKVKSLSHVWLLATPWTAAHQAPPSMGFSRQEYWSGLPYLST